ncbi:polyprenyl synthetase family protein [Kocuria coralli]|uniref:Polyprenyl synthetase family protein n=1 Tax=Kocuria coralli TaxID=1461025 RepID=A0A5J5KY41_9MICC|nr:polyprenyl synthetase family protein [Kocuria coralli]KAA9394432.1 polyprenyl synthetase family protein [Kocuria coralli]
MSQDSIASTSDNTRVSAETDGFLERLSAELSRWFELQTREAAEITDAALPLVEAVAALSTGGKRLRAQLLYWGWRAAGGARESEIPVVAAASLELFQTAALIHDDVIDRSDTRRSMPSVHKWFEAIHMRRGWDLEAPHFGTSSAILVGDMALTWSEQLFSRALAMAGHPAEAAADFATMRTEVMIGQYLDIHAEVAGPDVPRELTVQRALDVLRFKSAKYSAEHPVALGALLAAAPEEFVEQCRAFALPLGEAFQLRDDILGIFGDPVTTGKPAGDDLREGKRTAVIGLHFEMADHDDAALISSVLGRQDLQDDDVRSAREALRRSGALAATEDMVGRLTDRAFTELERLPTDPLAKAALLGIARAAVKRDK